MSIPISGTLYDPYGHVARFADIKFVTLQGSGDVIETSNATFRTDENGTYAMDVQFGRFAVYMRFNGNNGSYNKIQAVTVNSDTIATTLGELLAYTEPLTPDEILIVQALVNEAVAAKDDAQAAALQAATDEASAAASAAAAQASATAAANSSALLAPVPLNGGVWASGQQFTAYNQYMIYNGETYSPLPATTLPYTVGATPDLGFVYQISLNDHSKLANRNAVGAHDASSISDTNFGSLDKLSDTINNISKYGYIDGVTSDATAIVNNALSSGRGIIDLQGYDIVCNSDITVPSSSQVSGINLSGGKLTVKTGVLNIQKNGDFTIDLGGGEIDLGLKKAQLSVDAPNGNVFNVVSAADFSVGDVVTCSFDLNKLPNDTARSTLPSSVLNTIQSISGNQITMTYAFAANGGGGTPGYTSIPTGAWIVNSIFSKAGIYYTGAGKFTVKNGLIGRTSSGTAVAVNNANAVFVSQGVDYDEAGLDMFNLRCKDIIFDTFNIGTSYDVAKQGVVAEWSGLLSMSKGKFKRNNFDGEFYLSYNSQLGDMHLSDVQGDGLYEGGISTGAFSGNSIFVCKMPAANIKLKSLKIDRCKFTNYQRSGFGSGDDVVTTATIGNVSITDSDCNVPWLRTTFSVATNLVSSNYIKISGGSMGCSASYRSNTGFTNVEYNNVDLIASGTVRYLNCQIDNCRFNGGSHAIDSQTVVLGANKLVNSGKVLLQTGQVSQSASISIPSFKASEATGTFFPITNYVDSSLGQYHPRIDLIIPDFCPKVTFGNSSASVKYTVELNRVSETSQPFDCKSRHAVYIVQGSLVRGVSDSTLYKSTVAATSVMSTSYSAGATDLAQNNSGTLPSVGDIFAVLYANDVVGYHRITAATSNSFTISPALREAVTTSTLCGLNKLTKLY